MLIATIHIFLFQESPSPPTPTPQPVSSQTVISTLNSTTVSSKHEPSQVPPTSILKPGSGPSIHQSQSQQMQPSQNSSQSNHSQQNQNSQNQIQHNQNQHQHSQNQHQHNQIQHQHSQNQLQHAREQMQHNHSQNQQQLSQNQQPSPADTNNIAMPPAPPERGSSFAVMSMRVKESKRVSFNDAGQQQMQQHAQTQQQQQPPNTLALDESIREDPNVSYIYTV